MDRGQAGVALTGERRSEVDRYVCDRAYRGVRIRVSKVQAYIDESSVSNNRVHMAHDNVSM